MIINTVGKIILKDGKLVFERFGAAVAQKIKLGTAAFANIVNNATTTEEGFVPDARVVAQQQETISALQEQVNSLNSASIKIEKKVITVDSTGLYGNINLSLKESDVSVICAYAGDINNVGYLYIPFTFGGNWYLKTTVFDMDSQYLKCVVNATNFKVTIEYINKINNSSS